MRLFILLSIGSGLGTSGRGWTGNFRSGNSSGYLPENRLEEVDSAKNPEAKSLTPSGSLSLDPVSRVIYDTPAHLETSGNYLYVGGNALVIVDVSNVSTPGEIGRVEFGHCLTDVSISDSHAYASVWDYLQFYVVEMDPIDSPEVVTRAEVKGYAWGIDTYGDYAFPAMGASTTGTADSGGLAIFDINNPETPLGHSPAWDPATGNHDVQVYVDPAEMLAYVVVGAPLTEASSPDHRSVTPGLFWRQR